MNFFLTLTAKNITVFTTLSYSYYWWISNLNSKSSLCLIEHWQLIKSLLKKLKIQLKTIGTDEAILRNPNW